MKECKLIDGTVVEVKKQHWPLSLDFTVHCLMVRREGCGYQEMGIG